MGKNAARATRKTVVLRPIPNHTMASGSQVIPGTARRALTVVLISLWTTERRPERMPKGRPAATAAANPQLTLDRLDPASLKKRPE
jgi:hypothetical protein